MNPRFILNDDLCRGWCRGPLTAMNEKEEGTDGKQYRQNKHNGLCACGRSRKASSHDQTSKEGGPLYPARVECRFVEYHCHRASIAHRPRGLP